MNSKTDEKEEKRNEKYRNNTKILQVGEFSVCTASLYVRQVTYISNHSYLEVYLYVTFDLRAQSFINNVLDLENCFKKLIHSLDG